MNIEFLNTVDSEGAIYSYFDWPMRESVNFKYTREMNFLIYY